MLQVQTARLRSHAQTEETHRTGQEETWKHQSALLTTSKLTGAHELTNKPPKPKKKEKNSWGTMLHIR